MDGEFECDECSFVGATQRSLDTHRGMVHPPDLAECGWCGGLYDAPPAHRGTYCSNECFLDSRNPSASWAEPKGWREGEKLGRVRGKN